ncbi:MAG: hypothetical protein QM831_21825 [Kofleriaceae bacterium]
MKALEGCDNPELRQLAEDAFSGDPHAYAKVVGEKFAIKTNGKKSSVLAYNTSKSYESSVEKSIDKVAAEEQQAP